MVSDGLVRLVGDEPLLPYEGPPLSTKVLSGAGGDRVIAGADVNVADWAASARP